jgi:hypothetical protein
VRGMHRSTLLLLFLNTLAVLFQPKPLQDTAHEHGVTVADWEVTHGGPRPFRPPQHLGSAYQHMTLQDTVHVHGCRW